MSSSSCLVNLARVCNLKFFRSLAPLARKYSHLMYHVRFNIMSDVMYNVLCLVSDMQCLMYNVWCTVFATSGVLSDVPDDVPYLMILYHMIIDVHLTYHVWSDTSDESCLRTVSKVPCYNSLKYRLMSHVWSDVPCLRYRVCHECHVWCTLFSVCLAAYIGCKADMIIN